MATLNTGTSVIDFLKSTGKASDFNSRKSLYEASGLKDRLGDYTGSVNQNTAFLKQLQTSIGPVLPTGTETPAPVSTTPPPQKKESWVGRQSSDFDTVNGVEGGGSTTNIGAYDALSALGYSVPTADEVAGKALESTAFKTFQEGQEIKNFGIQSQSAEDKAKLEGQAASDTKKTIESFGSRGLFFSGMREEAVNSIVDALASSKLGVDRDVAQKLLEQGQATKEEFIKIASDIAKDAQAGNKQALDILEKQGLTIGLDGKTLVPTLAAKNAERAERSAELAVQKEDRIAKQADESARIANERLRLAEDNAARADARLALSEAADARAQVKLDKLINDQALGASASERLRNELKPIFAEASAGFAAVADPDTGYVTPEIYLRARAEFINSYPDKAGLFDNTYAPQFLKQEDRTKLGIEKSLSPTDLLILGE